MEILWLGYSCFRIKGKEATVLTDPYRPSRGLDMGRPTAEIVTVSCDLPGHNNVGGVVSARTVVDGPGEYEVSNVMITGIATFVSMPDGGKVRNTIYLMEMDELKVCHLGVLDRVPSPDLIETLGSVDILMVPIARENTIQALGATEIISLLEPRMVVPMHFQTDLGEAELNPVHRFLKEMGIKNPVPQSRSLVTKGNLPGETQVVLLDCKR